MQALCQWSLAVHSTLAQAQRRPSAEGAFMLAVYAGTMAAVTSSPFYSSSCSEFACAANSDRDHGPSKCSCNAGGTDTISSEEPSLQHLMPRTGLPCELSWKQGAGGCSRNAGLLALRLLSLAVLPTATHSQRLPARRTQMETRGRVEWSISCKAGHAGTASAVTRSPFYSSSCLRLPVLRTQMGTRCRLGAHAIQSMHTCIGCQ